MKSFFVYFIFLIFGYASAMTDDEAMMKFGKFLLTCANEKPMDPSELIKLQQLQVPTKPEVKCLLACAYRKFGTLRSDGKYDSEASYKLATDIGEGDEKRLENAKKLADICLKVNDEPVTDGEKGCEIATLMFKCMTTNAPKLGFKVQMDPASFAKLM